MDDDIKNLRSKSLDRWEAGILKKYYGDPLRIHTYKGGGPWEGDH
jgi:hypothetical protein